MAKNQNTPSPAEKAARRILDGSEFFDGSPAASRLDTAWPNANLATAMGRLPSLTGSCHDAVISALDILCRECGLLEAIRKHGMHAIWSADMTDFKDLRPMPRFFFSRCSPKVAEWMMNNGLFAPTDVAIDRPGVTHLIEAVLHNKDFALWLVEQGASFADPGHDSVYLHLEDLDDPRDRQIAQIALEQGVDPWQPDSRGRYPIEIAITQGASNYAIWLLEHIPELPSLQTLHHLERLACICEQTDTLPKLAELRACAAERDSLGAASTEFNAAAAARAGELALRLIACGKLTIAGNTPNGFPEFEKLAMQAIAELPEPAPEKPSHKPSL